MIKLILLDIDGVITDGKLSINSLGEEFKNIDYRDIDAVFAFKRKGYLIGFITGESTEIVHYFKQRFEPDYFYCGRKDKDLIIEEIINNSHLEKEEICFVGDGINDIKAIQLAGVGVCPNNAINEVKLVSDICLKSNGGSGCIKELLDIITYKDENINSYFEQSYKQHMELFQKINNDIKLQEAIKNSVKQIVECYKNNGRVLVCGNGGSAADAQHIVAELVGRFYMERKPLDAEALTTNSSIITALGNDYDYNIIFSRQVEAKGKKGDVLIGLSTSGKSNNVLKAFKIGKEMGMNTIALVGESSNDELIEVADTIINMPSSITPRIQEAHIFIGHLICEMVEANIFGVGKM